MGEPAKLVIQNIGFILSGKIEQPILDGGCIIALGGKIAEEGMPGTLIWTMPIRRRNLQKRRLPPARAGTDRERPSGRPYV
ncbi:MAG: hypothetical protein AAGA00_13910 [Pseudomonadota bacterium]